jgi:hypothetical protein
VYFALSGVGVCVDLFAVHKQVQHAGTARCIFVKCTVKDYFVANNTLCQTLDLTKIVFTVHFSKIHLAVPACYACL